ncbi:xyloglucan endotransglucosylase/hydrolase protein 26 [Carex littledalei]|uniref:Xyloglucan endotransglucosylase/hydrolase n=1 Tax=Carex littledalei TaxID=544730 RepID=A0A833RK55_9POAL|nr:xyloglucan endotransglucosylase/hydrolase protein 26 [Carex littledalei]
MATAKVLFLALISLVALQQALINASFASNTKCTWGYDNCQINDDRVKLILNKWSGAAIEGYNQFIYGYIDMRIKLVPGNSAAVVTTYYTSSEVKTKNDDHDEIDFEFLGNLTGGDNYYTLHTNIFVNGVGNREEQFRMSWYDPTSDYHHYTIFWNPYMVVWSVDGNVIRVFRNYNDQGIPFPKYKPQRVYSSIWNADDWACQGGKVKTNWTYQPFVANYLNYQEKSCLYTKHKSVKHCNHPSNWYFNAQYKQLTQAQLNTMNSIRNQYLVYNYCTDTKRFNGNFPPECSKPQY